MRKAIVLALLGLAFGGAQGDVIAPREDFLHAQDRLEWHAGALYDGRFEDGTRFQIQLAYPRPAAVPDRVLPFPQSYWYPRHYTDEAFSLTSSAGAGTTLRLVLGPAPDAPAEESFRITLAPDLLSGEGYWTSSRLGKAMAFTLQRAVLYDEVAVQRPAAPEILQEEPERRFTFAAWFPVLGDADADAWVREHAGRCTGDLECVNQVQVRWKSGALLSLDASAWEYNYHAAHGNGGSTTRQYGIDQGRLVPLGLDAFVDTSPACAASITAGIVGRLQAKQLPWAEQWAKDAPLTKPWLKFTPTASGIAFSFDPYEVGPYSEGSPSVFLTRAQLGSCLRSLPAAD